MVGLNLHVYKCVYGPIKFNILFEVHIFMEISLCLTKNIIMFNDLFIYLTHQNMSYRHSETKEKVEGETTATTKMRVPRGNPVLY